MGQDGQSKEYRENQNQPPMPRRDAAVKAAQLAAASAVVLSGHSASAAKKRQVKPVRSHPPGFAASPRQSG